LKFGVMIGPIYRKKCWTFGDDAVPASDSGLLFRFPQHCGIGGFL